MSEQVSNNVSTAEVASNAKSEVVLDGTRAGIFGLKSGMTQVFSQDGDMVPVTVIDLRQCTVTQIKTTETNGYNSVQVGLLPKKMQRTNKAERGHFKKSGYPGFYHIQELRVSSVSGVTEGSVLSPDFVKEGDLVDVTATSKGKGYQGGMKRFNMAGGAKSHGASLSHRSLGSIGNRADPAKCFKNKKMPGHMGSEQTTIQNLRVVSIDHENQLMLLKGSIPGPKNGVVLIRKAVKAAG